VRVHAQLGHDRVELLGEVDVDGGFRADLLIVGQAGGGADGLVVFVARGEHEDVLAREGFRDLVEELGVLLDVLAAHDDDGHGDGVGDVLGELHALLDGLVGAVGIGALKMEAQEGRALHRLSPLGHVDDGLAALVEGLLAGHVILGHAEIGQFDADLRRILDFLVEGVEGQHILAADRRGSVANTEGHFIDPGVESLFLGNKRHNVESPYIKF